MIRWLPSALKPIPSEPTDLPDIGQIAQKVRSKNAGPFWLTIDIFCGNSKAYETIVSGLSTERIAASLHVPASTIKRFNIEELQVVKFSLPRPQIQGSIRDRDMHGASWAAMIAELEIN